MTKLSHSKKAAGLAFLTAAVTLFVQILVHRMVSVKLLNNYAFLVISLTMLGFAFSGVVLSRWLPLFLKNFNDSISLCAVLFVLSLVGASFVFSHVSGRVVFSARPDFVISFLRWMPFALLYAIPFAFCGLILGTLLSSPELSTRRVYFFDLCGSAFEAFIVIPAISHLGVETSMIAACIAMFAGALLLCPPAAWYSRFAALFAIAVIVLSIGFKERVFRLHYPSDMFLAASEIRNGPLVLEYTQWDPLARIEISRLPRPDALLKYGYLPLSGDNPAFISRFKRILTQNGYAFTYAVDYDGKRDSLNGIEQTIYAAAYQATSVKKPKVAVIGVGGGFDILNAIYFDATDITGIEINGATADILTHTYRDYFRKWVEDPRVHLVHAEGRNFLARTREKYDVIQLSGVDSYSGTPGAANVFSENYLYTSEAFDLYLSRLSDNGILNMMRVELIPPQQMFRALTTAVGALRRAGIEQPADHIMMLTEADGAFTALLVKKAPFTPAEQQRLEAWTSGTRFFKLSAGPRINSQRGNAYQIFLSLRDPRDERDFIMNYPFDISPAEDTRPFFFKNSFWWHVFPSSPMIWGHTPVMEYSILLLLIIISFAALLCIYIPLRYLAKLGMHARGTQRYGLFFAGTGIGYLAIEIALLQKFGLFLGHPNYALSVVLASLLLTSGLGSLFSRTITKALGEVRFVSYTLAALILLEYSLG